MGSIYPTPEKYNKDIFKKKMVKTHHRQFVDQNGRRRHDATYERFAGA